MDGLNSIGVRIEASGPSVTASANDTPILNEIRLALQRLVQTGEPTVIDLLSTPLAPGEQAHVEAALGEGELKASIDALGPSEVRETAFAGVWLVTHYNTHRQVMGKYIEITPIPQILKSHPEDIRAGLARLNEQLGLLEKTTDEHR